MNINRLMQGILLARVFCDALRPHPRRNPGCFSNRGGYEMNEEIRAVLTKAGFDRGEIGLIMNEFSSPDSIECAYAYAKLEEGFRMVETDNDGPY
jgi:hypothetical protein